MTPETLPQAFVDELMEWAAKQEVPKQPTIWEVTHRYTSAIDNFYSQSK